MQSTAVPLTPELQETQKSVTTADEQLLLVEGVVEPCEVVVAVDRCELELRRGADGVGCPGARLLGMVGFPSKMVSGGNEEGRTYVPDGSSRLPPIKQNPESISNTF